MINIFYHTHHSSVKHFSVHSTLTIQDSYEILIKIRYIKLSYLAHLVGHKSQHSTLHSKEVEIKDAEDSLAQKGIKIGGEVNWSRPDSRDMGTRALIKSLIEQHGHGPFPVTAIEPCVPAKILLVCFTNRLNKPVKINASYLALHRAA